MEKIIGVRFRKGTKQYYFSPNGMDVQKDDGVIVETVRGVEYGVCATGVREEEDDKIVHPLKPIIRIATPEDKKTLESLENKEKEAMTIFEQKIAKHGLEMLPVSVEYTFDSSKIVFFFTADGRVDFRELVKDLAGVFHTRIELCQIGVRDETKMMGGLGPCGRVCCCHAHMSEFQPVSIKMAKDQGLSLNPVNISGLCGRLMCCLKYEQNCYEDAKKRLPKVNTEVMTPDGHGVVAEIMPLPEKLRVKVELSDGTLELRTYPLAELEILPPSPKGDAPSQTPPRQPKAEEEQPAPRPAKQHLNGNGNGAPAKKTSQLKEDKPAEKEEKPEGEPNGEKRRRSRRRRGGRGRRGNGNGGEKTPDRQENKTE